MMAMPTMKEIDDNLGFSWIKDIRYIPEHNVYGYMIICGCGRMNLLYYTDVTDIVQGQCDNCKLCFNIWATEDNRVRHLQSKEDIKKEREWRKKVSKDG